MSWDEMVFNATYRRRLGGRKALRGSLRLLVGIPGFEGAATQLCVLMVVFSWI